MLHWPDGSMFPWSSTLPNSQIAHGGPLLGSSSCPVRFLAVHFAQAIDLSWCGTCDVHISRETVVVYLFCQHKLQYLMRRSRGSAGLTQMTACFTVIFELSGNPQMQHWQQIWCCIGLTASYLSETSPYPTDKLLTASLFPGSQPHPMLFLGWVGGQIWQQTMVFSSWGPHEACATQERLLVGGHKPYLDRGSRFKEQKVSWDWGRLSLIH